MKMDSDSVFDWFERNFGWLVLAGVIGTVLWFAGVVVAIAYVLNQL
jgi:hypothetical protein